MGLRKLVGVLGFLVFSACGADEPITKTDRFAQCLTGKRAVMYGTEWCHYCQEQKEQFGNSFKYINYVDCDEERDRCLEDGIWGYPTWKIGRWNFPGKYSLKQLSKLSGCELEEGL